VSEQSNSAQSAPLVALGVTGSIAAYKAADLTSALVQAGVNVQVLMTASAMQLVQAQTFLTLSRQPVITDLWTMPQWQPGHIELAERAALLVIAPATANFIGKLANGIADDALTSYALSHQGPVLVAPAMNPRMWAHAAVQANCQRLRERAVVFVGPDSGRVACGDAGRGRLAPVAQILDAVLAHLAAGALPPTPRRRIVVTAGPTREFLDPVRFLTNRSSGKMGYAIAAVAAAAGHDVTLISGPTELTPPPNCRVIAVTSAAEMHAATRHEFAAAQLLIMAAAVADYRPSHCADSKLKKTAAGLELEWQRTTDILAELGQDKGPDQVLVGFAAETENLEANAAAKLAAKNLDYIVGNDISRSDIGFAADANEVCVLAAKSAPLHIGRCSKRELAARLLAIFLRAAGQ